MAFWLFDGAGAGVGVDGEDTKDHATTATRTTKTTSSTILILDVDLSDVKRRWTKEVEVVCEDFDTTFGAGAVCMSSVEKVANLSDGSSSLGVEE